MYVVTIDIETNVNYSRMKYMYLKFYLNGWWLKIKNWNTS